MLSINTIMQRLIIGSLMVIFACTTVQGQTTPPTWWFGVSGAANFNFYDGTTQTLNNSLVVPTAFHKGNGVRPYGSILMEYRPAGIWGGMLNVGYDGRGGNFDKVVAPCDCPATLQTGISYVSVEPSLRISVPASGLYFFTGPRFAFNINSDFEYTQLHQPNTNSQFTNMHSTIISGQVGAGYDILVSAPASTTQVSLSPFVSFQPYFGQAPRTIESWQITTVRAGIALKFGKSHKAPVKEIPVTAAAMPLVAPVHEFVLSARGPLTIPATTQVSETLPLLNSVFFDLGSTEIPNRYITLTKDQAASFREDQLQNTQAEDMNGRSAGQLTVYHNILNIVGDRMRSNPGATISLNGSSAQGPADAKAFAGSIKQYLVNVFGIDGSRIAIKGSYKAHPASEHPGGTKDLGVLHAENRRVDIETTSPELLNEVGGGMMKPVQIVYTPANPMDSQVVFSVDSAKELLKSWSIDATDEKGNAQHFGPYSSDQQGVPVATILGVRTQGDYTIAMQGETNNGTMIKKQTTLHLAQPDQTVKKGFRYSIVFAFDSGQTMTSYKEFLTTVVAPLIIDGATVTIHGHTDNIGEEAHNLKLSDERARDAQKIIQHAIANSGRDNVKFETTGFGGDPAHAPFENALPEERFYNRTVIIDIVPVK